MKTRDYVLLVVGMVLVVGGGLAMVYRVVSQPITAFPWLEIGAMGVGVFLLGTVAVIVALPPLQEDEEKEISPQVPKRQ